MDTYSQCARTHCEKNNKKKKKQEEDKEIEDTPKTPSKSCAPMLPV
jgi:hypothetical protein